MQDILTIFYPGDGVKPGSNKATYKNVKDFADNGDGTITFKTQKHGTITTSCTNWRLKKGLPDNYVEGDEQPTKAAARRRGEEF